MPYLARVAAMASYQPSFSRMIWQASRGLRGGDFDAQEATKTTAIRIKRKFLERDRIMLSLYAKQN